MITEPQAQTGHGRLSGWSYGILSGKEAYHVKCPQSRCVFPAVNGLSGPNAICAGEPLFFLLFGSAKRLQKPRNRGGRSGSG